MKPLTLLPLVALLAACGGGGGSPTPAAAPPVAKPLTAVLIDAEGDSTMCGYNGAVCVASQAPPAVLQSLLGPGVTVQNNGLGGSTLSYDLYGYTPYYPTPIATRLSASAAQIVLENFALNDAVHSTPAQYRIDLGLWVDTVRAMGKTPVLEEPNPTGFASPVLDSLVAIIDNVAQEKGVALIQQYAYIQSIPDYQSMLVDGVHPTPALYAIKAQREAAVLLPIVEGLQK